MTLIEALENEETRKIIDCIEDIEASLDGRDDDEMLLGALESACAELESLTELVLR